MVIDVGTGVAVGILLDTFCWGPSCWLAGGLLAGRLLGADLAVPAAVVLVGGWNWAGLGAVDSNAGRLPANMPGVGMIAAEMARPAIMLGSTPIAGLPPHTDQGWTAHSLRPCPA
jgi:hypothetical protein